ncbi:uncharacterized protein LOC135922330 [Gordionus sp. m RMFG-2023]|uniref:uncharacterized protein LOC135922330 n=1 Tax=Gordionus sp. m RMFG-2023 TaxID=3053472 RepID=UPI0031FE0C28
METGCRYPTLAYSFKIGISTVQKIISTTCQAIWQTLVGKHMPPPTLTDFERIAKEFEVNWNLPNCVGCIDGKNCRIRKPPHSGSGFYNYKHFFSVVLQGIVDAKGKFITVDVGSFGSESDGGVFANSKIYKMIENGEIQLPPSKRLPNSSLLFPHFFADDAYPLKSYILKPYKGILTPQQEAFNYRISRARIQVECAFGILRAKWMIFDRPMDTKLSITEYIIKTCTLLHNIIIDKERFMSFNPKIKSPPENLFKPQSIKSATNIAKFNRNLLCLYLYKNPIL